MGCFFPHTQVHSVTKHFIFARVIDDKWYLTVVLICILHYERYWDILIIVLGGHSHFISENYLFIFVTDL